MEFSEIRRRTVPASPELGAGVHPVLRRIYAARGLMDDEELDLSAADRRFSIGKGPNLRLWRRPRPWWVSYGIQ